MILPKNDQFQRDFISSKYDLGTRNKIVPKNNWLCKVNVHVY